MTEGSILLLVRISTINRQNQDSTTMANSTQKGKDYQERKQDVLERN